MKGEDSDTSHGRVDAQLKVQDRPIIEVFSRSECSVLLTSEVGDELELSNKQVRRRLDSLADEDVLGKRDSTAGYLWWLEEDVREPVTAKYPLLGFIRDRLSVQFLLIGLGVGVVCLFLLPISLLSIAYDVSLPLVSKQGLLEAGVLAGMLAGSFLSAAVITAVAGWIYRYSRPNQ